VGSDYALPVSARFGGRVLQVGSAEVEIHPTEPYLETRFPDGLRVPAAPQTDAHYAEVARQCGYQGPDATWRLCVEHELSHHFLDTLAGDPWSWVLHAVARGLEIPPADLAREESKVLAWQRYVTTGEGTDALWWLDDPTPEQAREQWAALLASAAGETG
jgi:hypothetical protein